ncbi:hypothetical protein ACQEU8_18865 [Streptomyces sp. CA-250714]|uniref:hypothetical protein n=1 Tax=Streptomyces sp. CA-250714 TaxID=3240060 RepID=UPI003D948310
MLTALVSAKSDGVTTSATAMALASSRPVLLAELDLSGGTLRHGLLRHAPSGEGRVLDGRIGLHRLPRADWARGESESLAPAVDENLWPLDGSDSRVVLPGLTSPAQAPSLAHTWPELINVMQLSDQQQHGFDVLADCGRLVVDRGRLHAELNPVQVLQQADVVLLVVPHHRGVRGSGSSCGAGAATGADRRG